MPVSPSRFQSGSAEDTLLASRTEVTDSAISSVIHSFVSWLNRVQNTDQVLETHVELKRIPAEGLGVRKRENAISVLKELDGFTENSAKKRCDDYVFQENGLYSAYAFALHVEQNMEIPGWAENFRNIPSENSAISEFETIALMKPEVPQWKVIFRLGETLGKGVDGEVFKDADDSAYLIKRYFKRSDDTPNEMAAHECEMFTRYYGDDSAQYFVDDRDNAYLRMFKVPGQTLTSLPKGVLPDDATARFVDMLEKLNNIGIIHGDQHEENTLWDAQTKTFFPIDIWNVKEDFFASNSEDKEEFNKAHQCNWEEILEIIDKNKFSENSDSD